MVNNFFSRMSDVFLNAKIKIFAFTMEFSISLQNFIYNILVKRISVHHFSFQRRRESDVCNICAKLVLINSEIGFLLEKKFSNLSLLCFPFSPKVTKHFLQSFLGINVL